MKPDVFDETVTSQLDMLDLLTRKIKKKGDDFKAYDYPIKTIELQETEDVQSKSN